MQNLNVPEKSRGIVGFAFNTEQIDYVSIANKTMALASHVLRLPYTLITEINQVEFDNERYSEDYGTFIKWRNVGRFCAYDLSPYDETLVIDIDYIVQDRELLKVFDTDFDYRLLRTSHALTQEYPNSMGPNSLPFVWATVFAFRKTDRAAQYFKLVKRVQDNYGYYRALFNLRERNYRNDYAFAIADIIFNGYAIGTDTIPGSMLTIDQPITSITVQGNTYVIRDENRAYIVPKTNLHIMSKKYLQSDNFAEFINNVAA
jgi:hypothetical protein